MLADAITHDVVTEPDPESDAWTDDDSDGLLDTVRLVISAPLLLA